MPSKRQTRRSISVQGATYKRASELVAAMNRDLALHPKTAPRPPKVGTHEPKKWTVSNLLEALIAAKCEGYDIPVPEASPYDYPNTKPAPQFPDRPAHFTF